MTRRNLNFLVTLVFAALFISCLQLDSPEKLSPEKEQDYLQQYLNGLIAKGHNIDTTESGVYYVKINEGIGPYPKPGDTLTVGFAGYFVDGSLFVSSSWDSPSDSSHTFIYGKPAKIKGWDDAMKLLNKNAKAQFIIPSNLAFGSSGQGAVPPYTTLVYVIKMKKIGSPK